MSLVEAMLGIDRSASYGPAGSGENREKVLTIFTFLGLNLDGDFPWRSDDIQTGWLFRGTRRGENIEKSISDFRFNPVKVGSLLWLSNSPGPTLPVLDSYSIGLANGADYLWYGYKIKKLSQMKSSSFQFTMILGLSHIDIFDLVGLIHQ